MKVNFRKIASVTASLAMLGSTLGVAAAASYPKPFVSGGSADVAIVYGSSAAASDVTTAIDIQTSLNGMIKGSTTTTTASVSGGDAVNLASGSDLLYMNDDLGENVQTLTDDDLATILADGTFTDDEGDDYDYEQSITIGQSTTNNFAFSDSDNDFDDPTLMLDLSTSTGSPIYTWTVTFDEAVGFNNTPSEGEELSLFGKTYTVGTATDANTLVLLGGSDSATVNVGESVSLTVGETDYDVTLTGISDATNAKASLTVSDGSMTDSKTFTEGQTKSVAGIDVFAKTVFRTGDNAGYVELQVGADKLTLEHGNAVKIGTDEEDIDGTSVSLTPSSATGVSALTKIEIAVAAEDNDVNHVLFGESFVDPVFGTLQVNFADVLNGPVLDGTDDTSSDRTELGITLEGDRELGLMITDANGEEKTVPFVYQGSLGDDDSNSIHVYEGAAIADEEYFILNSGNFQHFMQMTKVNVGDGDSTADDDVEFKDLFSGTTYKLNDKDLSSVSDTSTITINNQVYTVTVISTTTVSVTSSDYSITSGSGKVAVYPYLELIDGKDHRVAITDDFTIQNVETGTTFESPTGDMVLTTVVNTSSTLDTASPGEAYYVYNTSYGVDTTLANISFAMDIQQDNSNNIDTAPGILFVEEEDESAASSDTKYAIYIGTSDDGNYASADSPVFTGSSDTETFDDSDFVGYLTNFGTYVLKDSSDDNQVTVSFTYPEEQMYADVFFGETDATITAGVGGSSGSGSVVFVKDTEISSAENMNLIVIGGSCVNTVARKIIDSEATSPICGADFTSKTKVGSGQYLIKAVASPYNSDKVAVLVAGYEAADTISAAKKLKEGHATDVGTENMYPLTSA